MTILYKDFLYVLENEKNFTKFGSIILEDPEYKQILDHLKFYSFVDRKNQITKYATLIITIKDILNKQRMYGNMKELLKEYK